VSTPHGQEIDTKTISANGQQWNTVAVEAQLGDKPLDAQKTVSTRTDFSGTLDSKFSEAVVYSEKTSSSAQKDRTITVEKGVPLTDPNPDLTNELASAKMWSEQNDTADLKKLARSGVSVSDSLSSTVTGADGKEHKSTDTRTFNKDGTVTTSHEDSDITKFASSSKTATVTLTNHTEQTLGADGVARGTQTYATKSVKESAYELDGAFHSATHTDFVSPQLPTGGQQSLAPHVSQSLEQHLSQNGYSAQDAAQTVRDIGPQLAQAINDHSMGQGGAIEFHQSGPVAVSLASTQAEAQPGVVSVAMDQLKAVHESGMAQNLSQALALANTSSQTYQACREM
jgi:DNA uptake protein ComE-like DNA-binding protein